MIFQNLETGLQSLILKSQPEIDESEKARSSNSSVPSAPPMSPPKEKDKSERLPTSSGPKTQQKDKPTTADSKVARSSSFTRPGTSKKTTPSSSQTTSPPSMTLTGVPEKSPSRKEERRKTIDGGKTVIVSGYAGKRKPEPIGTSEISPPSSKSGGSKANSPVSFSID